MGRAGRKLKPGKRWPSGKRKPDPRAVVFDKGTERAQAMQVLYGTDGCDAIGRAYRAGLLGSGQEAKALLDTARRISNAYWRAYATGTYTCPLAERTHGSVVDLDHARIRRTEEWLGESLTFVRRLGPSVDRAFRQLVIDVNPDCGPHWLDQLVYAERTRERADPRDQAAMRAALDALEQLTL